MESVTNQPPLQQLPLLPTESQKGKVAVYCRVASTHQLDNKEIYVQLHKLREYVKQQGFVNCTEYLDNGYSGNNLNRPAFSKMQSDIEQGEIDTVIVSCINRIARDVFLLEEWISYAKARGVRLIALNGFYEQPFFVKAVAEFLQSKREVL